MQVVAPTAFVGAGAHQFAAAPVVELRASTRGLPSPVLIGSTSSSNVDVSAVAAPSSASSSATLATGFAAGLGVAALAHQRRRQRTTCYAAKATPTAKNIAKGVLKRLRTRAPGRSSAVGSKKMPPAPDPWEIDEEGRKIFPWPKSFAEIVQTAAFSTMKLLQEGETRIECDFPPLPLADLDWNTCDISDTRVVDSNIQHAIAFSKLIIKDPRPYPKLDAEKQYEEAMQGGGVQDTDRIQELLAKKFQTNPNPSGQQRRTVRMLFPNKPDMLRARDVHYEKWRKMERPELLRRGYYNEVNQEAWEGPFEDVYVYVIAQDASELRFVRNYIEKSDAVAAKQGRVLRHVLFNMNLAKLRGDIQFYKTVVPFRPGLATQAMHFDFLTTFRNAYFIRFGKYTMTILRDPYNVNYTGACLHAYPSPWQIFLQGDDGAYRVIDVCNKRPSISCLKRRLQRGEGLMRDAGLPWESELDDVYVKKTAKPGTIEKDVDQLIREGFGDGQWWETEFDQETSDKWRL